MNLTSNKIEEIERKCFQTQNMIKSIILRQNEIFNIENGAFEELNSLHFIDLSRNRINLLRKGAFCGVPSRFLLIISYNPLANFDADVFEIAALHVIKTTNSSLCCIIPEDAICQVAEQNVSAIVCKKLFHKAHWKTVFWVIASILLVLSFASFGLSRIITSRERAKSHVNMKRGKVAFHVIIQAFSCCNLLLVTFWGILLVTDTIKTPVFFMIPIQWRSSTTCHISCGVVCTHVAIFACMVLVTSYARYSVVKYPFESKFKSETFMQSIVVVVLVVSILFAVTVTLCLGLTTALNRFCLPLVKSDTSILSIVVMSLLGSVQVGTIIYEIVFSCLLVQNVQASKPESKGESGTVGIKLNLTLIVSSHIVCWVPSLVIYFMSSFSLKIDLDLIFPTLIAISPIASFLNPFVLLRSDVVTLIQEIRAQ